MVANRPHLFKKLASLEVSGADDDRYNLVVGEEELPPEGRQVDTVLTVMIADDELVEATVQPGEGERRRERAQDRFERLSRRPPQDKDERNGTDS